MARIRIYGGVRRRLYMFWGSSGDGLTYTGSGLTLNGVTLTYEG